jgi:hypothetical protein
MLNDYTTNNNETNIISPTINLVMQTLALGLDLGSSNLGSGSSLIGPA